MNKVHPAIITGNGLWNIFSGKKKYTIQCGHCGFVWSDKVPFNLSDQAASICPACHYQNVWSHSAFQENYKEEMDARRGS